MLNLKFFQNCSDVTSQSSILNTLAQIAAIAILALTFQHLHDILLLMIIIESMLHQHAYHAHHIVFIKLSAFSGSGTRHHHISHFVCFQQPVPKALYAIPILLSNNPLNTRHVRAYIINNSMSTNAIIGYLDTHSTLIDSS